MKKYILDDISLLITYSDYQLVYINNHNKLTVVNFDSKTENPFYIGRKK